MLAACRLPRGQRLHLNRNSSSASSCWVAKPLLSAPQQLEPVPLAFQVGAGGIAIGITAASVFAAASSVVGNRDDGADADHDNNNEENGSALSPNSLSMMTFAVVTDNYTKSVQG